MKLKVLGSGNISSKCNSASYLIDDNILVDIPNGTCKILKKLGIEPFEINNVLITHFHGDHYFDLPFMLLDKIINGSKMTDVFCDETGESKIYDLTKLAFTDKAERLKEFYNYNNDREFKINDYSIEKITLKHSKGVEPNGLIFKQNDTYVGFTGDTGMCDNVELMASKCNHLFCDCTKIEGANTHMGVDNILYLAEKFKNCIFYTSHMSDDTRAELDKLKVQNVVVLKDYEEFEF